MRKSLLGNERGEVIPGATLRTDAWWIEQVLVVLVLGGFVVYATWAALQNAHYYAAPYLSPFYSPCLAANCQHVTVPLFGSWWNLVARLPDPVDPRRVPATCYYYRKAYYRSFFGSPPACAVRDWPKRYIGRDALPVRPPEHPPLLLLALAAHPRLPVVGRPPGVPVPRAVRDGAGHARPRRQRVAAVAVLLLVPLLPAPVRRPPRRVLDAADQLQPLEGGDPAQRAAHALRVDQPSGSGSPISTCGSCPWASSAT